MSALSCLLALHTRYNHRINQSLNLILSMNLKQLSYFLAVASAGSFTKAAEQIPLAQSALSRHMRMLEEELGTTLLIRTGRGVEPTEQGEFLVSRARSLLEQSEDTKRNLQSWNDNPAGLVRLGMTPTCTLTLASPVLRQLKSRYENVSLQVTEGLSASLSEWMGDGRLDMAIVFTEPKGCSGSCERIACDKLCLIVPAGSDCPDPVEVSDMAAMSMIAPFRRIGLRNRMDDAFKQHGLPFSPAFEIDGLPAIKDLVRNGAGAAIVASSAIARELENGEVEVRSIHADNMLFDVYLLISKSAAYSRAAQGVADIIREIVTEVFTA
jgi:LysR family nitrogen assimilation transcriptional regulator